MIGTTISHYKILEKLGEGGMGVVYKAQDTKLDRLVALKFLPKHLASSKQDKARFIQEAKAASALDHPNICTIYEVDETSDDQLFIAMALYEGKTLHDMIPGRGEVTSPLPVDSVISLATQIAEGLQAAHEKAIIHRDIKSSNIIVTAKGQVKIMDFGLAKTIGSTMLTKTGATVGTAPYMSPEQARGENVDRRTDIWSLGVVMYEMAAGRLPFQSAYSEAIVYSILNEDPPLLSSLRTDVPIELERIVKTCLQKKPANRYRDAEELLVELKSFRLRKPPSGKVEAQRGFPSIAVLPFHDMSPEKDQEYFCDGLAEELINMLTKIKDARVVARTSAFSFKGKETDVREIGRKLHVETVLEGSVRKAGNRLRITAQLVNVDDGYHLWSERYDRDLTDVFAIQDEITLNIMEKLRISLVGEEKKLILKHHTDDVEAHSLYLKGRHFSWLFTEESFDKAKQFFSQALSIDPNYAPALAGLADAYTIGTLFRFADPRDSYQQAKAYSERALRIDPTLGDAHLSSAIVKMFFEWKWKEAEEEFKQALALSPGSAPIRMHYSIFAIAMEKVDEAIAAAKKAIELDPLSPTANQNLGWVYFALGFFDESLVQLRKALELSPNHVWAQAELGWNYAFKGMYPEAVAECEKALSLYPQFAPWFTTSIACVFAMAGEKDRAKQTLDQLKAQSKTRYIDPWNFALLHTCLGDYEEGMRWLEKACDERSAILYFIKNCSHLWLKPISSDPRFRTILRRMGLDEGTPDSHITPTQIQDKSIVVLPFENNSPDKEDEYFSDGLSEEIIMDLSKIHSLRVISRSSAMKLKGTQKDVKTIGRELNVRYVLEGSVRKAKDNLRITAELVDTATDTQLWAEKYNGTLEDVFDIQEKLSRQIVEALKVRLTPEENRNIADRPIANVHAYEYYLRARRENLLFTESGLNKAIDYLQAALKLAGENELIYFGIGYANWQYVNAGIKPDPGYLVIAQECLEKIIRISPDSPHGHRLRGFLAVPKGNTQEAVRELKIAYTSDPNDLDTLIWLGLLTAILGKPGMARPFAERLVELDPLSPLSYVVLSAVDLSDGAFRKAVDIAIRAEQLDPAYTLAATWHGYMLALWGKTEEAREQFDKCIAKEGDEFWIEIARVMKYALTGNEKQAREFLTQGLKEKARVDFQYSQMVADCYALIGDTVEALNWLENSVAQGNINYPFLAVDDKLLQSVRGEERFQKLMEEVKPKWEAFEV